MGGELTAGCLRNTGVKPVFVIMNVLLEHILGAIFFLAKLLASGFSGLAQRIGDVMGPLGSAGLYLLLTLFGLWLVYQLLRILSLIVLRILLPVAAFLAALFVLVILVS